MGDLTPEDYLQFTRTTAIYPKEQALNYLTLGLVSEAGEVAGKLKKLIRDGYVEGPVIDGNVTNTFEEAFLSEVGDVLWYITRICDESGYSLSDLMLQNKGKLESRLARGVLGGSGDKR